ncbi:hypothetical protein MT418_003688 [Batrachochytrium dendrobatidis]
MNRSRYRVTCINDCAVWRHCSYYCLLNEPVTTFYNDSFDGETIVGWCKAVVESEKQEMMDTLIPYINTRNLQQIVIFNQHNALFNASVVKNFPFNIISTLADNHESNIKLIISASVNNDGYHTKMKG